MSDSSSLSAFAAYALQERSPLVRKTRLPHAEKKSVVIQTPKSQKRKRSENISEEDVDLKVPLVRQGTKKKQKKINNKGVKRLLELETNNYEEDNHLDGYKKNNVKFAKNKKVTKSSIMKKAEASEEDNEIPEVPKLAKMQNRKKKKTFKNSLKAENGKVRVNSNEMKFFNDPSSVENGRQMFSWIICPVEESAFFKKNWEVCPIHIKRNCFTYYSDLLSCEAINDVLRNKTLYFGKNIDVTSYNDGVRQTHNPGGRASAPTVWDFYNSGCSVRMLNPQTYFKKIHKVNATLHEFFGCFVGANVYLTPPGTQGFAPHYDDIEAFVLQIEGKKRWKLYPPRCPAEILPRVSSENFTDADLSEPIMDIILEPGDLLYFPRGIIHQGHALNDVHSLHITISMYQRNSWADLLEELIPAALKMAVEEDVSFRSGLPMHYLQHMGVVHSDTSSPEKTKFMVHLESLIQKLVKFMPVEAAVDQMGKRFMHDALPPCLSKDEKERSVFGDGETIAKGQVANQAEIGLDTRVKLLRYNALRLVMEEETIRVYYSVSNSREYHGEDPQFLEIDENVAPAIEALIKHYPRYLYVEELPLDSDIDKVQIIRELWENGLLLTEEPLGYTSE